MKYFLDHLVMYVEVTCSNWLFSGVFWQRGIFHGLSAKKAVHMKLLHTMCSVALVVSDSLWPYGLWSTKCLCPWDSTGKNTGVNCHALLQGIFLTQESNLRLLHLSALADGFFMTRATWKAQHSTDPPAISPNN